MKKYIFILTFLLSLTLLGCTKKQVLLFDKNDPKKITIAYEGDLKSVNVSGNNYNDTYTDLESFTTNLDKKEIDLDIVFFSKYPSGNYVITIEAGKKQKITVKITGENVEFDYIKKQEVFDIKEDKYYVVFSRSGCSGCERLYSDLIAFNNFLATFPKDVISKLYFVDYSDKDFEPSIGKETSLIGISSYEQLINDVKMSTPTIIVIEKGVITEYYIGYSNCTSFIHLEMDEIQNSVIVHNIDDPKAIALPLDFEPTSYSITYSDGKTKDYKIRTPYDSRYPGYNDGKMNYSNYFFNSYLPGNYKLKLYDKENASNAKEYTLIITSRFNYIDFYDLFNIPEENYYVFFLRDGCSGCNAVKPMLMKYSQYHDSYDSSKNYPLYAVHRSQNAGKIGYSEEEVFVGAKKYEDIKLGFYPRVILIQNGEVTELYANTTISIATYFQELMSKVKK